METNMSTADQVIRVVVAEIFVALYLSQLLPTGIGITLLIVGALLLISAVRGYCHIYALLGINTCEKESAGDKQFGAGS